MVRSIQKSQFQYRLYENSGDLIWIQTIDSFKKDWREFGKERFVIMKVDTDSADQQSN